MIANESLRAKCAELGFSWFGVARAGALEEELLEFTRWIDQGRHGDMEWLAREPERRCDPRIVLPGCRSVVIVGLNYLREPLAPQEPPPGFGKISKYARSRDYHRVFENLLKKLKVFVETEAAPGSEARFFVDYGPLMERPWAARAGIGFVGKHTLLINPKEGSFHFLGALVTTAEIEPSANPRAFEHFDGCGDCRRCIDACPTGAITEPWKLDARRCLSYLTIEKEGPIEQEFWPRFEGNVFGCDICQDVCPYNQSRAVPTAESPLGPAIVEAAVQLAELIGNPEGFLEQFADKASPLKRAGADSLRRNAIIVASQRSDEPSREALERLLLRESPEIPAWLREEAAKALALLRGKRP